MAASRILGKEITGEMFVRDAEHGRSGAADGTVERLES
jgi:hypothetical protein